MIFFIHYQFKTATKREEAIIFIYKNDLFLHSGVFR